MKKYIIVILMFIGGYGMYSQLDKINQSSVLLENIEALAQTEIGPAPEGTSVFCAYGITYGGIGILRACESCVFQYFVGGYQGTSNCYPR